MSAQLPIPPEESFRLGRHWSLWEMINFMIPHYMAALRLVQQEIAVGANKVAIEGEESALTDVDKDRIRQNIVYVGRKADELGLESVRNRLERVSDLLRLNPVVLAGTMAVQMNIVLEAFEDDTKFLYLYCYPRDKAQIFLRARADWQPALKAFPAIDADLEHGTDLYALGHNMACVFHLMRVAEIGVQSFGKKLGVSLTKKPANRLSDLTWHQILDALNPKLKAMSQKTAAARAKHEKYSAIQSYLYAVKDAWRNPTMHPRKAGYDDSETLNIMNQLRSFMNELASVIAP
ncbi:MAG: hypothetical protein ABSD21_07810 [Rhizomicrobium sp.]|jgi:hypothetical protein